MKTMFDFSVSPFNFNSFTVSEPPSVDGYAGRPALDFGKVPEVEQPRIFHR